PKHREPDLQPTLVQGCGATTQGGRRFATGDYSRLLACFEAKGRHYCDTEWNPCRPGAPAIAQVRLPAGPQPATPAHGQGARRWPIEWRWLARPGMSGAKC